MNPETFGRRVMEITQAIVAILVIGVGLVALVTGNTKVSDVVPFMTLVLGYYFGRSVPLPEQVETRAGVSSANIPGDIKIPTIAGAIMAAGWLAHITGIFPLRL